MQTVDADEQDMSNATCFRIVESILRAGCECERAAQEARESKCIFVECHQFLPVVFSSRQLLQRCESRRNCDAREIRLLKIVLDNRFRVRQHLI